MKQYIYYIVLMLSLCSLQTAAQNGSIKGVIKSKGKPIENVQISIEGRPNAFFQIKKVFINLPMFRLES